MTRRSARRARRRTIATSMPAAAICSAIRCRVPGRRDAGVGDEQHPAGAERREVVADLGGRAGAELERGRGVGEDRLAHRTTYASRPAPRPATSRRSVVVEHGDRHPGDRVGGAVAPRRAGLAVLDHGRVEDQRAPSGSPRAARRCGAARSARRGPRATRPTVQSTPALLAHLADQRLPACSPWSTPPPGSVHQPGWGRARSSGSAAPDGLPPDQGVRRRRRCCRNGRWSASASSTIGTTGHRCRRAPRPPAATRPRWSSRRPRGPAAPGASTGTQPSYTIRSAWASTRRPSRQTPGQVRGVDAARSHPPGRPARSPRGPRGSPRRAGPPRGRGRRRAASRAPPGEPGASRLSRMRSSRRMTAYAATRCRCGSPLG